MAHPRRYFATRSQSPPACTDFGFQGWIDVYLTSVEATGRSEGTVRECRGKLLNFAW